MSAFDDDPHEAHGHGALFDGAGVPSQVDVLALFDAGDATPAPRKPRPEMPGQLDIFARP